MRVSCTKSNNKSVTTSLFLFSLISPTFLIMSDGLEFLSNKDLLAKCRQYGLPVIPVTESTRNVIIRRLRATILGVPLKSANSAASKKSTPAPRRETLHGGNVRRSNTNNNIQNSEKHNRRTIAHGLDNISFSGRSVETTTTVSDVGSQSEEDDDYYMVQVPDVTYSKPTQTPPHREDARLRRSVSLTKSGVLTTSYTRGVEKSPRYEEADEIDEPQTHTYERPRMTTAPIHSPPVQYEPEFRQTFASDLNASMPRLTQTRLNSTSYQDDEYNQYGSPTTFKSPSTTFQPSPTSPPSPRYTIGGSPRSFGQDSTTSIRQRQTTGGSSWPAGGLIQPTTKVETLYPKLDRFYERQPRQSPSSRHEPMETDSDSDENEPQLSRSTRFSPQARPQMRRPLVRPNPQNVPMQHFRELIISLDRQYHLRYYLLLTVIVMIGTLVYVLVTPS